MTDSTEEMKDMMDEYMSRRKVSVSVGVGGRHVTGSQRHTRSEGGVLDLP